jgi:hypothetical protein
VQAGDKPGSPEGKGKCVAHQCDALFIFATLGEENRYASCELFIERIAVIMLYQQSMYVVHDEYVVTTRRLSGLLTKFPSSFDGPNNRLPLRLHVVRKIANLRLQYLLRQLPQVQGQSWILRLF